ncbi:MAG: hypothetical protein ACD_11C00054G0011 [uncultured bacterium]|nr:MAG: hypothetical protein ACD_11C00054G0011 [uncultured bacterium]HBR71983.1 hypothetical protein [Candidatus Moranbacteria bacterium]
MINRSKKKKSKKILFFLNIAILFLLFYLGASAFWKDESEKNFSNEENKKIVFNYDGNRYILETKARTVEEFFSEKNISVGENDNFYPSKAENIFSNSEIFLQKARKIEVLESGEKKEIYTLQKTIGEAVREKKELNVSDDDIIKPDQFLLAEEGMKISITHVEVREEKENEPIAYKTISNENDDLGWREKKVTQKGEKGTSEVIYKVVYYDGKEISRKIINKKTVKEPTDETVTQGTYIKLGKTDHTGLGTWYAQPTYLEKKYPSITGYYAANPWLPMGSYAKVTNKENGKSIIVRINDRGPFGPNRIIDLGKNAFSAIASLGAGIINVKVEEVKN